MEENGIERTDKASFLHPTPKYPAGPKYPALSIPLNTKLGKNPLALGHGTAWDHYKMENFLHPTLKYLAAYPKIPSCPKIPSSVDTPKCPAWRNLLALGHGTAWDHYKMEYFLHPTPKYPVAPKYPALSIPQNTQFGVFLSTSLGFGTWPHGTTIK